METSPKQASGTAHGKIILIGEHAVVYGEPAIALPFMATPVKVSIKQTLERSWIDSSYYQGPLCDAPQPLENLSQLIRTVCSDLSQSADHLFLTVNSSIPAERGMGSSAAVATAVVRALFSYFNASLSDEQLLHYVDLSEKIAHGNPSGIDAHVAGSNVPVYFRKGHVFEPLSLNISGHLIAADTGITGQTLQAVSDVADLLKRQPKDTRAVITHIGQLTLTAKVAIETDQCESLGRLMTEAHNALKQLNVSNETLDHLVETALDHGALGAKLTGGGRGGCMIALTRTKTEAEDIANKLMDQGAVKTWIHALGADKHE